MESEEDNLGTQCRTRSSEIVSSRPAKRTKRSDMWKFFVVEKDENGEQRAYCQKCPKSYSWFPTSGTSNLINHYKKFSLGLSVDKRLAYFDEKIAREKFSRVIIRHNLPFLAVEYEELRDYLKYLNPYYKCITRNTVARDVVKIWEKEKVKLKAELDKIPSRICITSDCWSSLPGDGYIVLTAHYVDDKWILHSKILSLCDLLPPHTADILASKLHECIKEWGIEKKVFSLTLDNARANDCMQDILRDRLNLDDNLLCKGEFFHIRCSAHILNLIVQNGLEEISDALAKIRDTLKYVKASMCRRISLAECIEGDGEVVLSLDVCNTDGIRLT